MLVPINDPADPRLDDYRNLTDAQLRARDHAGVFIAESELVVRRLLRSRFPTRSLLLAESARHRLANLPLPDPTPVYLAPDNLLTEIVGFPFHRGVLAAGGRLPAPPLTTLLQSARLLVILEDTANTDNMGAVFRNTACLAGRGAAILLSPGCCDPLYRKALRVSIGYALTVPFGPAEPWPAALADAADAGFTLVALTPDPHAEPLEALPNGGRYALLLGAEGPGLSPAAMAHARRVRIPMAEGADSLNVATAAAVALSRLAVPQ